MLSEKETLKKYLDRSLDALLWKIDGLGERDVRWPHTPTGTNLLGLVKHVGTMVYEYFGAVFDRPPGEPMPWIRPGAEVNADMWATAEESKEWVIDFYRRAWTHANATIDELELTARGRVPWWRAGRQDVTLHQIMVHVIDEAARHAGHADIIREGIDESRGLNVNNTNLPDESDEWWREYVEKLKRTADEAGT